MERTIAYAYDLPRKFFGKQPLFSLTREVLLDSIDPNLEDQKDYGLRNPVNRDVQVSLPFSETEINTISSEMRPQGINHCEGGWPKEVHYNIEEETIRYRRRIEREDNYINAIMKLTPRFERFIKQNNAVEIYQQYFKDMHETHTFEHPTMKLNNVFRDPNKRPVAGLCWTNEDDPKLAVTYCEKKYPVLGPANTNFTCYLWELENPETPATEFVPPTACWSIACSPINPKIIVGGLDDGRVCVFDLRAQKEPISLSPPHTAHRGPVSALLYIQSRLTNEFFTGSSDGQCIWHDLRNLSEPLDALFMSVKIPPGEQASFSNAEGVSALQFERTLPTRFLCGTETGLVLNVNRKGKSHGEVMSGVYRAQNGPVRAVHRSPCTSKVFLSCGDWRVHIWSDDVRTSPIITGMMHRYQIMDAVWAPEKLSAYMTVAADGKFRYWDLLRRFRIPAISMKLSRHALLKVVPHEEGRLIALGGLNGIVFLVSLSEDLVLSGAKDKQLMLQTYEREGRREHILTTRMKEIRLKIKEDQEMAGAPPAEEPDAEALVKAAEEEYRRQVIEEFRRSGGIPPDSMRKRNYLQRLELFEKSTHAYNEALRWNSSDVPSLLGRSLARAKSTQYTGALADAAQAAELEPRNSRALQIRAQTEYEKCAFERALLLAHRGQRIRRFPPDFAECARCAEETVRECAGETASKVLQTAVTLLSNLEIRRQSADEDRPKVMGHHGRMQPQQKQQVQEISRAEKQRAEQISRLMASKYLERMAHDKYFLTALCKDERLVSANKQGSQKLQELANKALADVEKRQAVLRERRPLYAARALEAAARARLSRARKEQLTHTQLQHATDANRLIQTTQSIYEERDTAKCLEHAEFGMEQITRKPASLLPGKDKFLQKLHDIVANAFLDQKRVRGSMSESDRERRAFILLGMSVSREPSRDSVLRVRPPAPPRDAKTRLRTLERALSMSTRESERCYLLHELARLNVDTKQALKARVFASKCQTEARASNQRAWLLNALFLLARCHLLQNNRPEARAVLLEAAGLAHSFGFHEVADFYDTCVNVSLEGEVLVADAPLEKREKDLVSLMQDDDLRSAAKHLFKRMSLIPASRRFSIMPGARIDDNVRCASRRRLSIMPKSSQPSQITRRAHHPLGFQDFDL